MKYYSNERTVQEQENKVNQEMTYFSFHDIVSVNIIIIADILSYRFSFIYILCEINNIWIPEKYFRLL